MKLTGELLIGETGKIGTADSFHAINPATGETMAPAFTGAAAEDVAQACRLAEAAFEAYRASPFKQRADLLDAIAENIAGLGDELIERAVQETGLPKGRIEGERARTIGQLKLFAAVVREGSWLGLRVDPALPERQPLPRPDLRLRNIPLGPVAVFGASNFPLAFSVAGGDTASALAAGCPVVVKAHPAHPGTSELVGRAIQAAVAKAGLPEGVFSLLFGVGNALGAALVTDPRIKAVGFTGSRAGGMALVAAATARPEPIPVYAEMSSINPVFLMPAALEARAAALGKEFAASLTLGSGQFCTNPGLVIARRGEALDQFMAVAHDALQNIPAATMLHPGIFKAYETGVARVMADKNVHAVGRGKSATGPNQGQAALFSVAAEEFLTDRLLSEEVFGASSLVIICDDFAQMQTVLRHLEGQLTATLQMDEGDTEDAKILLPMLESKVGRILVNGWPTGVEVCHAMVHGGPFPSTSNSRTTSVGTLAIERFLRPVSYQNFPAALLPEELQAPRLQQQWHRFDGILTKPIDL